jgi:hypothetical protein
MKSTPRLHATIVHVLSQHRNWLDRRHLKPLAWMIAGLLPSQVIRLTARPPYVQSRAVYAQSLGRRFDRWLHHPRIDVPGLYRLLMPQAIAEWGTNVLSLALDTTLLGDAYCMVRLSLISRGRAIPMVWKVRQYPCSSVAYEAYSELWDNALSVLPRPCQVVFLADRGFADTELMEHLRKLKWPAFVSKAASGLIDLGAIPAKSSASRGHWGRRSFGMMSPLPTAMMASPSGIGAAPR